MARSATIYTRLSNDPTGTAESPDNHVKACRRHLAELGWEVVGEPFIDRGISGYRDKVRPAFDEMMIGIERGDFQAVCVVEVSRFSRNLRRAIPWVNKILDAGAVLLSVDERIDTSDPQGLANLYGRFANAETESIKISTRVSRGITERAAQGKPHSGRRIFGYNQRRRSDRVVVPDPLAQPMDIYEPEAKEAKRMVRRIIAGDTRSAIARDLNDRGVLTAGGGHWTSSGLRQWASSPTLAGIRRHLPTATEVKGTWAPIITTEQREQLLVRLGDRRIGTGAAPNGPRWLLSGIARCGRCGARMHVNTGTKRYTCSKVDGKGCGRIAASVERVDEVVIGRLLWFSANAHVEPSPEDEDPEKIRGEIETTKARLERLNRVRFVEDDISEEEWQPQRDELVERIAARTEALTSLENRSAFRPGTLSELADWWNGASIEEQRTTIKDAFATVTIQPALKQGCRFDPNRVELTLRTDGMVGRALEQLGHGGTVDEDGRLYGIGDFQPIT